MPVNYRYGNPADTMGTALEELKKYYSDIKSPDLVRMEDAYTRDNVNSGGQKNLVGAVNAYPKTGQIGSTGNAATMGALRNTINKTPSTYADLIAGQRGREQGQLSNYIAGAGTQGELAHTMGYNDSMFNDRVKQLADEMARAKQKREWELEINKRKSASEEALLRYQLEKQNEGSGFWSTFASGMGSLGSALTGGLVGKLID